MQQGQAARSRARWRGRLQYWLMQRRQLLLSALSAMAAPAAPRRARSTSSSSWPTISAGPTPRPTAPIFTRHRTWNGWRGRASASRALMPRLRSARRRAPPSRPAGIPPGWHYDLARSGAQSAAKEPPRPAHGGREPGTLGSGRLPKPCGRRGILRHTSASGTWAMPSITRRPRATTSISAALSGERRRPTSGPIAGRFPPAPSTVMFRV